MTVVARCMAPLALLAALGSRAAAPVPDVRPEVDPAAERQVLALERELVEASRSNDVAAVERLEAPDLVSTSAGGKVTSRADDIALASGAEIAYSPLVVDDTRVRIYGNTAISTFRVRYTYEYKGASHRREQRYTNTWIRSGPSWQLVASHYSTYGDSTH